MSNVVAQSGKLYAQHVALCNAKLWLIPLQLQRKRFGQVRNAQ